MMAVAIIMAMVAIWTLVQEIPDAVVTIPDNLPRVLVALVPQLMNLVVEMFFGNKDVAKISRVPADQNNVVQEILNLCLIWKKVKLVQKNFRGLVWCWVTKTDSLDLVPLFRKRREMTLGVVPEESLLLLINWTLWKLTSKLFVWLLYIVYV